MCLIVLRILINQIFLNLHFQCFEQCLDVLANTKSNPSSFWKKNQFKLIFHVRLSKPYMFNFFMVKPLRTKIQAKICIFVE